MCLGVNFGANPVKKSSSIRSCTESIGKSFVCLRSWARTVRERGEAESLEMETPFDPFPRGVSVYSFFVREGGSILGRIGKRVGVALWHWLKANENALFW